MTEESPTPVKKDTETTNQKEDEPLQWYHYAMLVAFIAMVVINSNTDKDKLPQYKKSEHSFQIWQGCINHKHWKEVEGRLGVKATLDLIYRNCGTNPRG